MELPYFYYDPSFVPFVRVGSHLVLDPDGITYFEWRQIHSVLRKPFCVTHVTVAECVFTRLEGTLPRRMRLVFSRVNWNEVPDGATEQDHGRGQGCITIWCVPVLKHGSLKCISVQ